jgi:hypothetical protein
LDSSGLGQNQMVGFFNTVMNLWIVTLFLNSCYLQFGLWLLEYAFVHPKKRHRLLITVTGWYRTSVPYTAAIF